MKKNQKVKNDLSFYYCLTLKSGQRIIYALGEADSILEKMPKNKDTKQVKREIESLKVLASGLEEGVYKWRNKLKKLIECIDDEKCDDEGGE